MMEVLTMNTSTFAHAKDDPTATKLFDKTGKNYIDCILDFIDNAKISSVDVEDIEELEERFRRIKEETERLENGLKTIKELQDDLLDTLTKRSIEPMAKKVEQYFQRSGYLDNLNTKISEIYMTRWAKYIVDYMQRKKLPIVKLDMEKLAVEVAKYLMAHCRKGRKCEGKGFCDTCEYIKDSDYEQCHCVCD